MVTFGGHIQWSHSVVTKRALQFDIQTWQLYYQCLSVQCIAKCDASSVRARFGKRRELLASAIKSGGVVTEYDVQQPSLYCILNYLEI